jgi:DnaJ-domain-containing protein 1
VICQSCKQERPIEWFAKPRGTGRRSRRCSSCKKWATCAVKRWHKKGRECSRCAQIRPCPEEITDFAWRPAVCQECQKAKARERQAAWAREKRQNDPEFRRRQIATSRRWQERNPDYVTNAERRRYQAIKADPVRQARHREDARMRYRLRQMQQGRNPRMLSAKTYAKHYGTGFGAAATVEVADELRRLTIRDVEQNGHRNIDKRVREIASGQKTRISLVTADRLCVKYGLTLSLVYPELAA